jgi:hypothetical protein
MPSGTVEHASATVNGGFPDPPAGLPVRVVSVHHGACGEHTRVRLPRTLAPRAIRRVICDGCAQAFEAARIELVELLEAAPLVLEPSPALAAAAPAGAAMARRLPFDPRRLSLDLGRLRLDPRRLRLDPHGPAWRWISAPLAAAVVVGALMLIQSPGDSEVAPPALPATASAPATTAAGHGHGKGAGKAKGGDAHYVRQSTFSLALPAGWHRVSAEGGATFAAAAIGGGGDATLWVERDPKLDFPAFEARSLDQLRQIAGSARVVDRVAAPTADGTVVTLATDAPAKSPEYKVTLRVAGPYRYYLATTVEPDAPRAAVDGAELIQGSFTPIVPGQAPKPSDGGGG